MTRSVGARSRVGSWKLEADYFLGLIHKLRLREMFYTYSIFTSIYLFPSILARKPSGTNFMTAVPRPRTP